MYVNDRTFETRERIRNLIVLQKQLSSLFSEKEYNVFVFGSYPTVRYVEGESDVDMAVYADSIDLYKKISVVIEDFFCGKGIELDLFFIDINTPAPVFLAPLHAQIQFTDYYPKELEAFEAECEEELDRIKRRMAV